MKTVKEQIQKHLEELELGKIQSYRNLAVAPVLGESSDLGYLVLADALKGNFVIEEKGSGSVSGLSAVNRTGENILGIKGDYIVGGMQNRTLTRNIYFDRDFRGEIPVRCVQQGRWHYEGNEESIMQPKSRDREFRYGGRSPVCAFAAESQGGTWNSINCLLEASGVESSSGDLNELYEKKKKEFEKYKEEFPVVNKQVGNVAVIYKNGEKTLILDLFDRHDTLKKQHESLIKSYALEAGLNEKEKAYTSEKEISELVDSLDFCEFQEQEPISIGKDCKIFGAGLEGSALLFNDALVYMNLFTRKKQGFDKKEGVIRESFNAVLGTYKI